MIINMNDVQVLLEFFKKHVVNIRKGAKVLLERIEDFGGPSAGTTVDFSNIHPVNSSFQKFHEDDLVDGTVVHDENLQRHKQSVLKDNHIEEDLQNF